MFSYYPLNDCEIYNYVTSFIPDGKFMSFILQSSSDVLDIYQISQLFLFKKIYFSYLFLAALGLCCCVQAFSSCSEQGLLFVEVRGLLTAVASLVAEHGL